MITARGANWNCKVDSGRSSFHVVAGAIMASDGRFLIAQRPPGKHLAGWWEFPGGKVEPGEAPLGALARELDEELAVKVSGLARPLMRLRHTYPHGDVLLDMWVVTRYEGEPRGMDGQAIQWHSQEELETLAELLPADRPVVKALRLPAELAQSHTPYFEVNWRLPDGAARADDTLLDKLQGLFCECPDKVASGQRGIQGADFLVMSDRIEPAQLQRICKMVDIPVYACGVGIETAWALGATGISRLP